MLAKKRKLSKKEIKEDKLVTTFYEAKEFYEEKQTTIFSVIGIVVAIVIGVVLYTSKVDESNLSASVELSRVLSTYDAGLYLQAIEGKAGTQEIGLARIVDEYGGSEQGELARIYLANAYYYTEQYDKAMEEYANFSGNHNLLVASALAGKAGCYETKKDYESAAKYFSKAANVSEYVPSNPNYLLNAGINYLKIKNSNEAKNVLNKVKKEYGTSLSAREVDKYLALINS
ncbi:MAG: tetratricopeptide repeat protein [Melioribacteraceae bacterium]|nr:tetratricopeptide repeat protein [Melioribacteraceae bacterium]